MAFVHGKSAYLSVGGTDWSTYLDKVDFPRLVDTAETSTFGTDDKTYMPGLKGATLTAEGNFDATVDGYAETAFGTEVAVVYGPSGNATPKYSFQAILNSYNPPGDIGSAVKFNVGFQVTGAVSRT